MQGLFRSGSRLVLYDFPVVSIRRIETFLERKPIRRGSPWGLFFVVIEPLWRPLVWFLRRRGWNITVEAPPPPSNLSRGAPARGAGALFRARGEK